MQLPKQQGLKFLSDLARIWPAAWRTFWHTNKKVRVNKTLTWGFNGAGDGNRTRVMSLEGSGSTIEPHPRFARRLLYRKIDGRARDSFGELRRTVRLLPAAPARGDWRAKARPKRPLRGLRRLVPEVFDDVV